ncbi:hypothetical protein BSIN_1936 [Burkholderia singularis]|uniref:Uncharacterized protein n=1 Tax=Burkholderia singularis TaxID=1503053 RepID=A0A238H0A7_9BURK|nr:hypothetical protein BSIN_1936 [Burkholderia singularis]
MVVHGDTVRKGPRGRLTILLDRPSSPFVWIATWPAGAGAGVSGTTGIRNIRDESME